MRCAKPNEEKFFGSFFFQKRTLSSVSWRLKAALDIGMAIQHSTNDTLYVAFAIAVGARGVGG